MALNVATIQVDGKMLQTIYTALDELPGKLGRSVYENISAQISSQLNDHTNKEKEQEAIKEADFRKKVISEIEQSKK